MPLYLFLLFFSLPISYARQILGTGINSTGSAAPVYAPVAAAQEEAMKRAWTRAGRDPKDVDFVEVHATGKSTMSFGYGYLLI